MSEHIPEIESTHTPEAAEPAILQVGPQEELGSVLQRLRTESAKQVRLVVPDRAIISQGSIVMKLLADVAGKLNKEVSIVSDLPQVQILARQAGLKVEGVEAGDTEGHGFVQGEDVALTAAAASVGSQDLVINDYNDGIDETAEDDDEAPVRTAAGASGSLWVRMKQWVASHKVVLGVVGAFLIVAVGGFLMATYYLPQATVTLYTQKRTIDRDIQVSANPNAAAVDSANMVVPASMITGEASKTQTFEATGEEETGEAATGTIEITNKSSDTKTLPAGTVVSADSLQFVLDTAVIVPAYELDDDGISFGKATAAVTAADIGDEFNIDAGVDFTVAGYTTSTMDAESAEAFTGGSSETITIVTAQDRQQALETLATSVQDQAMSALQEQISSGQLVLEDAAEVETASTTYSHEVGAEVDEFSLTVEAVATAPVVKQSDLSSLLTGAIEERVPDGYELVEGEPEIETNVLQVDPSGVIRLTSTFKAQVVPVVDTEALVDEIKGQHPRAVENFLQGQPNLNGYDITLSPQLPGPFYRLPKIEDNIEVMVEVKE